MAIPQISANTLVDQTLLNTMITAINNNGDAVTRASSAIYDTKSKKVVQSYMGGFTIATNRVEDTIKGRNVAKSIASKTVSVQFEKTFLVPPLVFASVDFNAGQLGSHLPGTNITNVTNSGCTIVVNVYSDVAYNNDVSFSVSVMAVGLTQL
jgi:hypothetical protein